MMKKIIYTIVFVAIVTGIVFIIQPAKKNYIQQLTLTTDDSSQALIVIKNTESHATQFNFSLNGKFYASLNDFIRKNKQSTEPEKISVNLFDAQIHSLVHENLYNDWGFLPLILLNSRGFAICGKQSELFCQIMYNAGFPARTLRLEGHVVSEVYYNNAWHLFDTDRKTYFQQNGKILSYKELINNPSLFKTAGFKNYMANLTTQFDKYTLHFITTQNNKFIKTSLSNKDTFLLSIPPSSAFIFPFPPDYKTDFFPYNSKAKLFLPKGFDDVVTNPLILIHAEGRGEIKINKKTYKIPEELEWLHAELFLSKRFNKSIHVKVLSDSFALVYMLNPLFTDIHPKNNFFINASDSLSVSMIQYANTSSSSLKSTHVETLNRYAPFAFDLANHIQLSDVNSVQELFNRSLKENCLMKGLDSVKIKKRLYILKKVMPDSINTYNDMPVFYNVLSIVIYGTDEEFKNIVLSNYKYHYYSKLIREFKKSYSSKKHSHDVR